jgi:transcriptional regulator with XRE-family HTH domain
LALSLHDSRYRRLIRALVKARLERGVTQTALAQALGCPQSFLGKIETYQRRLDAIEFLDLLDALELDPSAFVQSLAKSRKSAT